MYCSDCGKNIDDDALICPICGAVTKNGIISLKSQEATNKSGMTAEPQNALASNVEKKNSNLKLVATILGLTGSALLLLSLLGNASSVTAPLIGTIPVSMLDYLGKMAIFVVILAGLSVLSSFLRYAILQILTGSITALWTGFMIWDILNISSTSDYSPLVSVSFGISIYLFILSACLFLASGVAFAVAAKKTKITINEDKFNQNRKTKINRKAITIVIICLGVLVASGTIGVAVFDNYEKTAARNTVSQFMDYAIQYDVDSMKSLLSSDVNDKNGLMDAYTPVVLRDAFLSGVGVDISSIDTKGRTTLNNTFTLFGKNYLKKYDVTSVTRNSNGTFTVKASASIINMNYVTEQIRQDSYGKIIVLLFFGEVEEICSVLNDIITNADSMDTEFTFIVEKNNGNYIITEIDYMDS